MRWANRLNDVLELPPFDFGRQDVGLLNLLCASSLPGSEGLDIGNCLARLDSLAAFVKASTERNLYRFHRGDCDYAHSEPMWRTAMLVTLVKRDFGVSYDPKVKADPNRDGHSPFTDSRNAFVHGMLGDDRNRRWGSCSSIPVLVAAVSIKLNKLNEDAIKKWWEKYKADPKNTWNIKDNCSRIALSALEAGGLPATDREASTVYVTTPRDIELTAERAAEHEENPPGIIYKAWRVFWQIIVNG